MKRRLDVSTSTAVGSRPEVGVVGKVALGQLLTQGGHRRISVGSPVSALKPA
jgi:hypothetical protein